MSDQEKERFKVSRRMFANEKSPIYLKKKKKNTYVAGAVIMSTFVPGERIRSLAYCSTVCLFSLVFPSLLIITKVELVLSFLGEEERIAALTAIFILFFMK